MKEALKVASAVIPKSKKRRRWANRWRYFLITSSFSLSARCFLFCSFFLSSADISCMKRAQQSVHTGTCQQRASTEVRQELTEHHTAETKLQERVELWRQCLSTRDVTMHRESVLKKYQHIGIGQSLSGAQFVKNELWLNRMVNNKLNSCMVSSLLSTERLHRSHDDYTRQHGNCLWLCSQLVITFCLGEVTGRGWGVVVLTPFLWVCSTVCSHHSR